MGQVLMRKLLIANLLFLIACSTKEQPTAEQIDAHKNDVEKWFANRQSELVGREGWLNVAGLFWLKEGINSFGSDASNDLVFPEGKIAANAGYFLVKGGQVTMMPAPDSELKEQIIFYPDSTRQINVFQDPLEWFIIKREEKVGVRLRDFSADELLRYKGIERYPVEYSWKLPATFEPAASGETIDITNVLGQTTAVPLTGRYVFEVDGTEYKLSATGTGNKLFVVFADATNGKETYGAGRFIYIDKPDSTGRAVIDFNKSYNPPCAFTEFATCPLPPKQNVLPVSILAGEKNYELHGKQASHTL